MASEEHKKLAAFIKATHSQLRKESRIYGPDEAWKKHIARGEVLKNYAATMQELATAHWNDESLDNESGTHCRNKWIRSQCYKYFSNGGKSKFDKREMDIRKKIDSGSLVDNTAQSSVKISPENYSTEENKPRIKVLDVGSCYNPLSVEKMFDVTAIDLAPFSNNVLQCDFLNVEIGNETLISANQKTVESLGEASFDVVVFSLLLEYFPCPEQRYECCGKAYKLLKAGGILLIITPDSNHVGANAKIMKSWRLVLSKMGFMRIVYEKSPHLHCLGFRKCFDKIVAARWGDIQIIDENDSLLISRNKIYIPQDFQTIVAAEKSCENVKYDADDLVSIFDELPCADTSE